MPHKNRRMDILPLRVKYGYTSLEKYGYTDIRIFFSWKYIKAKKTWAPDERKRAIYTVPTDPPGNLFFWFWALFFFFFSSKVPCFVLVPFFIGSPFGPPFFFNFGVPDYNLKLDTLKCRRWGIFPKVENLPSIDDTHHTRGLYSSLFQ